MKNISEEIFKDYRGVDQMRVVFGEAAVFLRLVTYVLLIGTLIATYVWHDVGIVWIMFLGIYAGYIVFIILSEKEVLKAYSNYDLDDLEENGFSKLENLRIRVLRDSIIKNKLYSREGLEHLINIYKNKSQRVSISKLAIGAGSASAIINYTINLILSPSNEKIIYLMELWNFLCSIKLFIVVVFLYLLVLVFILKTGYRELMEVLVPQNYKKILDRIQCVLLPEIISQEREIGHIKEIEGNDLSTLKILSELNSLRLKKGISESEYIHIKERVIKKI